jgi:nucleotide-binding universal stress UspA family protein
MYKHILIPTDGSGMSVRAAAHGVDLAKRVNARIAGLSVIAPWKEIAHSIEAFAISQSQYERNAEAYAASSLLAISDLAKAAGVPCSVVQIKHPRPWRAILDTAQSMRCDLILMASHGRRGLDAMIVGSETQKVLTHSNIPVLVFRDDGTD